MNVFAVLLGTVLLVAAAQPDEQLLKDNGWRAFSQRDRAFIESVLAPEWSVTQADGTTLTRSAVLGSFFDSSSTATSSTM